MSFLQRLEAEPYRFDYFTVLRYLERASPDKPRIGDCATGRDELVQLRQDPYMDFPASNLARAVTSADKPIQIFVKFLGLLGPQGALPLATTEEAYHYLLGNDDAFPRFLDIFNHRFIELFFRAWADSRPIVQYDRPAEDRFVAYIGSAIGLGSKPYQKSRQHSGCGEAGICRPFERPGEVRLAARRSHSRPVQRQSGG